MFNSPKDRILAVAYTTGLKEEMSISHLIWHIRVTEGVIKEKFGLNETDWKTVYSKYGKKPISIVNNMVMLNITN